jgi:hypothetical protein
LNKKDFFDYSKQQTQLLNKKIKVFGFSEERNQLLSKKKAL